MTSLPSEHFRRVDELIERLLERTLMDDEAAELLELFDSHPELEFLGRENFHIGTLLDFIAKTDKKPISCQRGSIRIVLESRPPFFHDDGFDEGSPQSLSLDMNELARLVAESPALPGPQSKPKSKVATKPQPTAFARNESNARLSLKMLAPLFLLVFGFMVYLEFKPVPEKIVEADDPFGPFPARISELVDAAFEEGILPFKKDQRLEAGVISLLSGLMEIEYRNGVRVVLEGPAEYHLETPLESACNLGRLSVYVPPGARGFAVTTPMMIVRDLGTKFVLDVDEGNTKLQVIEGEVEANWLTRDWLPFKEGRGVERREGKDVRNFVADPQSFVSESMVKQRRTEYFSQRQTVWNEQRARLDSDPSLLYRLEPEKVSRFAKTPGSREGKTALRFRSSADKVGISNNQEYVTLTLISSVRLKSLPNVNNLLLIGDRLGLEKGAFLWQVNRSGDIHFHVDEGDRSVRHFSSTPVVTQKDCNTWLQFALVADGQRKTIRHFVDGRPVATLEWPQPVPLRLDRATIGSESSASKKNTTRFFNGDIEDFWIFSRPFDEHEIEEFYHNNH